MLPLAVTEWPNTFFRFTSVQVVLAHCKVRQLRIGLLVGKDHRSLKKAEVQLWTGTGSQSSQCPRTYRVFVYEQPVHYLDIFEMNGLYLVRSSGNFVSPHIYLFDFN